MLSRVHVRLFAFPRDFSPGPFVNAITRGKKTPSTILSRNDFKGTLAPIQFLRANRDSYRAPDEIIFSIAESQEFLSLITERLFLRFLGLE